MTRRREISVLLAASLGCFFASQFSWAFGSAPAKTGWPLEQQDFADAGSSGTNALLLGTTFWSCTVYATQSGAIYDQLQESLDSALASGFTTEFYLGSEPQTATSSGQVFSVVGSEWMSTSPWMQASSVVSSYLRITDSFHFVIERDFNSSVAPVSGAPSSAVDPSLQVAAYEACTRPQP